MKTNKQYLHIDGTRDDCFESGYDHPPYVIFDEHTQDNISPYFDTKAQAQAWLKERGLQERDPSAVVKEGE
jgi:hypothetical protein